MDFEFECIRDVLLNIQETLKYEATDIPEKISHEGQNTKKIEQGAEWGFEFVRMTSHNTTCALCAKYQGRVYAVTKEAAEGKYRLKDGTILKFPYLYETAFSNGVNCIHPNCRHCIAVIPLEAYTSDQIKKFSENSMKPFEDTRSDEEKIRYDSQKAKFDIQNEQHKMYDKIKEVLFNDAPKSFSGFVKMEKTKSVKYQILMNKYQTKLISSLDTNNYISFESIMSEMKEKNYAPNDIWETLQALNDAEFIFSNINQSENDRGLCFVYGISYKGIQFLHIIKSEILWNNIKSIIISTNQNPEPDFIFKVATDYIDNVTKQR